MGKRSSGKSTPLSQGSGFGCPTTWIEEKQPLQESCSQVSDVRVLIHFPRAQGNLSFPSQAVNVSIPNDRKQCVREEARDMQ